MSGAGISGPGPSPPGISLVAGGSGSLTSTALVTGGGGGSLQTPSSTSTLDSSGNMSLSGTFTLTKAGALSQATMTMTGAPVAGGSATTTFPLLYLNSGTAPTTWSTGGTLLGLNTPSAFAGNFVDFHLNGGASVFKVASTGSVTIPGGQSYIMGVSSQMAAQAISGVSFSNSGGTGLQQFNFGNVFPSTIGTAPAQGQGVSVLQAMELLTIAAAASTTTTMLVPAGAIVLSVSVRVTTIIPTAATFTVTIGGVTFNTVAVPVAATTTNVGTAAGASYLAAATGVTITPNLTPGAATGVVRITVTYLLVTPPTS